MHTNPTNAVGRKFLNVYLFIKSHDTSDVLIFKKGSHFYKTSDMISYKYHIKSMKKKGDIFLPWCETVEIRFEMEISRTIFVHIVNFIVVLLLKAKKVLGLKCNFLL